MLKKTDRMNTNINYVAVLPDGTEFFCSSDIARPSLDYARLCEQAVRFFKHTTPWDKPGERMTVNLWGLTTQDGKLLRQLVHTSNVMLPIEPPTDEQFTVAQDALLAELPVAFRSYASYQAYERGHSAGHEEVLMILRSLVHDLKEPIESFRKQLVVEFDQRSGPNLYDQHVYDH